MSAIDTIEMAPEPPSLLWRRQMQGRIQKLLACVVPVVVAGICVMNETSLTLWAGDHQAVLPLAVIVLLLSLLSHRLRSVLILTLCYGVAFMAVRDIFRVGSQPLPQAINYDFLDHSRPAILLLIAGLSATAAFMETFHPGTVWARRCYFGAAALYFLGLGIIHIGKYGSWKAVLLCVTGVTAIFGCLFAERIVSAEIEEEEDDLSDEDVQGLVEAAHQRSLRAKEWHEPAASETANPDANASCSSPSPVIF
ncbi:MAG: hypothetical protein JWL77_437 [Chthonomonadaceae bacterium]|nr:hypothetical protein [Chthonomonadaceae bacterium]